jgi:hypothetical protein
MEKSVLGGDLHSCYPSPVHLVAKVGLFTCFSSTVIPADLETNDFRDQMD